MLLVPRPLVREVDPFLVRASRLDLWSFQLLRFLGRRVVGSLFGVVRGEVVLEDHRPNLVGEFLGDEVTLLNIAVVNWHLCPNVLVFCFTFGVFSLGVMYPGVPGCCSRKSLTVSFTFGEFTGGVAYPGLLGVPGCCPHQSSKISLDLLLFVVLA